MAKFGFDVAEVDVNEQVGGGSYEPIPPGEYYLKALDAEEKQTKDGTGSYINVKFEVAKGEHAGRLLWHIFNINNKSEKAQKIGRQQLVGWATACGKPDADDTDKLLDKVFRAEVEIQKGTGGYADNNRVKQFLMAGDDAPKAALKAAPKAAAPAAKSANPWD